MTVADASFLTSLFIPGDANHLEARSFLTEHARREGVGLAIPTIAIAEAASGFRQQGVPADRIPAMLRRLRQATIYHPVDLPLALRAANITAERTIRGCDAVYVALAERLGEPLVTFDRQQARAADGLVQVQELGAE